MDKLALPADLADWQAKFERIHLLAEWAWSAHWDRMQEFAVELEQIRREFSDAVIDNFRGADSDDIHTEIAWESARSDLYQISGYLSADTAVGCDHEGNPY